MDDESEKGSFKNSVESGFSDTKPGNFFSGILGGPKKGSNNSGSGPIERNGSRGGLFRRAEDGASDGPVARIGNSSDEVNQAEKSGGILGGGLFTGTGKGVDSKNGKKNKGFKGRMKKLAPGIAILGMVAGIGGLMAGWTTLMPFAIQELIIEKFNSIGISSTMASDELLDTQLNQGVRMENLKTGEKENLFAFSEYQVGEFEKQGIIVENDVDIGGGEITALIYKKKDTYVPVVGSDFLGKSGLQGAIVSASGISEMGAPISAKAALNDSDFKIPYTTASKTWRGGSSGWFDSIMDDITTIKLNLKRNRWARFAAWGTDNAKKEFDKIAKVSTENMKDNGVSAHEETTEEVDGETVTETRQVEEVQLEGGEVDGVKVSEGEVDVGDTSTRAGQSTGELEVTLRSKALKVASAASSVGDTACAVLEGVMAIYSVVSAYQNLQFLNLISGYLEAVSKVKAGDGSSSPMNIYNENLTSVGDTTNANGDVVAQKTAMESEGMAWLFSDGQGINPNDQSVQNVNFENIMSNTSELFGDMALTTSVFEKCGYVRAVSAAISLTGTILSFTGVGTIVEVAWAGAKEIGKIAVAAAVQVALYAIVPIAVKNIAQMMIKDAATEWLGEDLGNAMISGANKYLGGNAVSGGQGPGDLERVAQYVGERDTVLAEEAEYERATRSPFDVTSRHTFLGSLAYSMLPLAYSSGRVSSLVSGMSSVVNSSAISLLPTTSAISGVDMEASIGDCKLLGSTGAVGDVFCNPYIITDVSTMGLSGAKIDEIVYRLDNDTNELASVNINAGISSDNFNDDGTINKESNLAKYITYCGQRTSQYGIKDGGVYESIVGGGAVKSFLGLAPILGDIITINDAANEEWNMSWINGSACVASSDNAKWDSEYKYYQRYAEQQRLLENMNPGYKSTVAVFLEDYYKENPVDNSFEGTLARFSGLPKETVEEALALIEYYNFIENYEPSERYAFGGSVVSEREELNFDDENALAGAGILLEKIMYFDVRNRSYVV
ncbi:hypothetical protein IIY24_01880 [Candidatus Saccharibacteria bacterium]|nr:hypothetical protein [Candidatus Saccharibacteria bacterium]